MSGVVGDVGELGAVVVGVEVVELGACVEVVCDCAV
jgi:hypothetical protein